jgi:hypothetical protein
MRRLSSVSRHQYVRVASLLPLLIVVRMKMMNDEEASHLASLILLCVIFSDLLNSSIDSYELIT